eukprot:jgi/Phyca11/14945/fgenesh1_pg.PHYCAscaffold_10_\
MLRDGRSKHRLTVDGRDQLPLVLAHDHALADVFMLRIVVVARGGCIFAQKDLRGRLAGAAAVIIIQTACRSAGTIWTTHCGPGRMQQPADPVQEAFKSVRVVEANVSIGGELLVPPQFVDA